MAVKYYAVRKGIKEGAELCVFIPHQVGVPGGLLTQGAGAAVA